jgi:hypothetical protein
MHERHVDRAEMLVEMGGIFGLFVKNDDFARAEDSFETGGRIRSAPWTGSFYTTRTFLARFGAPSMTSPVGKDRRFHFSFLSSDYDQNEDDD